MLLLVKVRRHFNTGVGERYVLAVHWVGVSLTLPGPGLAQSFSAKVRI
jgi:hypothetical protein